MSAFLLIRLLLFAISPTIQERYQFVSCPLGAQSKCDRRKTTYCVQSKKDVIVLHSLSVMSIKSLLLIVVRTLSSSMRTAIGYSSSFWPGASIFIASIVIYGVRSVRPSSVPCFEQELPVLLVQTTEELEGGGRKVYEYAKVCCSILYQAILCEEASSVYVH